MCFVLTWGRSKGFVQSVETRAKIALGVKKAFEKQKEKQKVVVVG